MVRAVQEFLISLLLLLSTEVLTYMSSKEVVKFLECLEVLNI